MNKIWNINTLLCRKTDTNVSNIKNIFDKLVIKKNGKADFVIITIMSSIRSDEERFGLFYFIEYVSGSNRRLILYVGNSIFTKDKAEKERGISSVHGSSNEISQMEIRDCEFLEEGTYEIKIYKYDDDELDELLVAKEEETEKMMKYAVDSHLASVYNFEVVRE